MAVASRPSRVRIGCIKSKEWNDESQVVSSECRWNGCSAIASSCGCAFDVATAGQDDWVAGWRGVVCRRRSREGAGRVPEQRGDQHTIRGDLYLWPWYRGAASSRAAITRSRQPDVRHRYLLWGGLHEGECEVLCEH